MTIKEMIQHAYYDLLSLKVNWFNHVSSDSISC